MICVRNLQRRIAELERACASEARDPGGKGPNEHVRQFLAGSLHACSHIRRAPIDRPPWRYEANKLRNLKPFNLAMYLAALRMLEHEDEPEARKLLDSDARLEQLIDMATSLKASHS